MDGWVWSSGGMILTEENWSTGRKTLYSVGGRWMNEYGGMVLTGEIWSTGRKTLYSVGGRWMNEYGGMVEWYQEQTTKGLGVEPLLVSLFSTNSTLNGEDQTWTSKLRGQQPTVWAMAQPLTIPISLQHDTLPLQVCGYNWPSSCKLPVTDPPPALYHFTIYQHIIPSSWKKEAIFLSTMLGSTQNHTSS